MWKEINNELTKSYTFNDFVEAFQFMKHIAPIINQLDHHPFWSNSYNVVEFRLSTHESGNAITAKDYELAFEIDKIYNQLSNNTL
jgi:4a-hydroxytetrahydrobiopterin dehydratase